MAQDTRKIVLELLARNRAAGELASFSRSIDTTFRSVRRMATGLLTMAGVGGIGYVIRQEMKAIDETAKLSDRLGISTEALVAMQHGAKIAGIEQETLNKSLEIFSQRLGEAKMGTGEGKDALEALGLSFKDLIYKSPDEAIGIVADRIKALGTQAEKAAVASDLFGRSGKQLLNLFSEGSKGIKKYRDEVDKLGLSFSRIDAAKVEAANDALTRTGAVFTGLFRQTTIELSPYIESATTYFNNWATSGEGAGAKVVNAFESVTLSISTTIGFVDELIAKFKRLSDPMGQAAAEIKALERYRAETKDLMGGRYTYKAEDLYSTPHLIPMKQPDLYKKILAEERAKSGYEVVNRSADIRAAFDKIRQDAKNSATEATEIAVLNRRLEEVYGPKAAAQGFIGPRIESDLLKQRQEEIKKLAAQAEFLQAKWAQTGASIEQSMSNAFHSAIMEGATLRDVMEQIAIGIADSFARMASDVTARAIMNTITGGPMQLFDTSALIAAGTTVSSSLTAAGTSSAAALTASGAGVATSLGTAGVSVSTSLFSTGTAVSAAILTAGSTVAAEIAAAAALGGLGKLAGGGTSAHKGWVPNGMKSFHSGQSAGGRAMRSDEMVALVKKDELIAPSNQIVRSDKLIGRSSNMSNSNIESLLHQILGALLQRQTLKATIVDSRDVVTKQQMEGRDGEKYVMSHIQRNR